ncbi:MAG: hypothetical protein MZU79_08675 [Anaerotruncus sp.]|nr:hypothetical protein [Anaerotruncus sp.]
MGASGGWIVVNAVKLILEVSVGSGDFMVLAGIVATMLILSAVLNMGRENKASPTAPVIRLHQDGRWRDEQRAGRCFRLLQERGLPESPKRIGADEQKTGSALSLVVLLLASALAKNSSEPGGCTIAPGKPSTRIMTVQCSTTWAGFPQLDPHALPTATEFSGTFSEPGRTLSQALWPVEPIWSRTRSGSFLRIAAPLIMGLLGGRDRTESLDAGSIGTARAQRPRAARRRDPGLMGVSNTPAGSSSPTARRSRRRA